MTAVGSGNYFCFKDFLAIYNVYFPESSRSKLTSSIPLSDQVFDVHKRIGSGTFSSVLLATLKSEADLKFDQRKKFAIKHHIPTSHPDRIVKELKCLIEIG